MRGVLVLVLLLGADVPATAQLLAPNEPASALKEGKVLHAHRITGTPPAIDGRLDDDVWSSAESASGYIQREPDNGRPMTESTSVKVAFDDRYLYVAVMCDDANARGIAAGLGRRDDFPSSDYVAIAFDPRHDHLTGYVFETNPSAVQRDSSLSDDERGDSDYNAVWDVRTQVTDRGWTAEFRIPFSQMRFSASPDPGQIWGFGASRMIRRKAELGAWVARPRGERGEVSLFGHLVFDAPLVPPRRLELLPYALARVADEAASAATADAAVGADLRVGLGPAMTLSATVNPDFGQVEQDPAVLNLSVFETFFPEKRPFFLEDSGTFVPPYGLFQLFHSRRIGRAPGRFALPSDEEVLRRPDETTILGAAKLTGKSAGWTYGALTAQTAREFAKVEGNQQRLIEPLTSYNVARLQRDVLGGSSNIGALVTSLIRERSDDALTGGFDYNLRWDQNRTYWNGHWAVTRAPGTDGVRSGGGGVMNFGINRKYWNTWSHFDHFGRNFRVNDIGFFRGRTNRNQVDGGIALEQPDPTKRLRRFGANVNAGNGWNDEALVFARWVGANQFVTFLNFWHVRAGFTRNLRVLDDIDTRGGPPIVSPAETFAYIQGNSDSRKSWRLNFGVNMRRSEAGARSYSPSIALSVQPSGRLQLSGAARYDHRRDPAQWVSNQDTNDDGIEDHVYGALRSDVLDLTLRGTYAINRDLTFQAYLQPFVAVGDYDNIRRLARPRSYEFEPAIIPDDPDFNRKSLRGNMVLRWEYVPGSTLFVVWDLAQVDESRAGEFNPLRDLRAAFGASANHVLMVKMSYWLNR